MIQPAPTLASTEGNPPVGIHINWGQSEDYYRGFNRGYDDYPELNAPDARHIPADEPWAGAYRRGWEDGFATAREHDTDEGDQDDEFDPNVCPWCSGDLDVDPGSKESYCPDVACAWTEADDEDEP